MDFGLNKSFSYISTIFTSKNNRRNTMERNVMSFREIDFSKEKFSPFEMISDKWFLLTAGDESSFNTMTCSWGFMGVMWKKNVVAPVVRPQRYTREFLEKCDKFTVSFFDGKYKKQMGICGSTSGRDVDKIAKTGLTPVFSDGTTYFAEAETVLVVKKLFVQQMLEDAFVDKSLLENYAEKDFHYQYIGEILKAYTSK